ncbi:hypothetical protein [Williamsia deligens]|uniref:Ketohydroxyglutarate aldolase n=1 Tax=Williamsia deligens TaxID=321325 RepID=A0ABW3GDC8_9NOCA|nr:hypothetical protein [Williamsia deligens]MCP2192511.1 hypothetical protein [Williamsia deligens]
MADVTITVDDDHLAALDDVVASVRAVGVHVTAVHAAIGIISGTVADDVRGPLSSIRGVASIEQAPHFGVAPPDSPVQ